MNEKEWHLINVIFSDEQQGESRFAIRRMRVAENEQLRTVVESLCLRPLFALHLSLIFVLIHNQKHNNNQPNGNEQPEHYVGPTLYCPPDFKTPLAFLNICPQIACMS